MDKVVLPAPEGEDKIIITPSFSVGIYKNLLNTRANNNNLIDYISKTEEFYINKIESLNTFKKATPKDLIYLDKQITQNKNNYLNKKIKFIKDGLKDSKYQKGY